MGMDQTPGMGPHPNTRYTEPWLPGAGEADAGGGVRAVEGHRLAREHDRERLQQRAIHQQCGLGARLRGRACGIRRH